jgi:S1-C subfamily serine protease
MPSVVVVQTTQGLGSGVIYDSRGDIITNAHVVEGATTFQVTLQNGDSYRGTLVGSRPDEDIAVIKISAIGLTPAVFGDSSKLRVGQSVIALGNPYGLQSSATQGIVSAVGRTITEAGGNDLPDVIQTSAAINPGNSGGALIDLQGEVEGIPTSTLDPQGEGTVTGIGFAISGNRAHQVADEIIAAGR